MKRKFIILPFFMLALMSVSLAQQTRLSISNDLGLQRSIKKGQQYWAVGHTVTAHFHFTPKEGLYAWVSYFSVGKFHNDLTATAKSPITIPQSINYRNDAEMRFKHVSIGWKHYLKGTSDAERTWNIYGFAGFGLMLGRVVNTLSTSLDTSIYNVPVRGGKANFKRLTFDLGLGWEQPIGGDCYLYAEGKVLLPASDYPSKYLLVNKNAPLIGSLHAGVRILF